MKRPIREYWLFRPLSEGIYALERTSLGIWNLLFHARPLVLTITWKDLRWTLVFVAIWWFMLREPPPELSQFDRDFLTTRNEDRPTMVRKHLPKAGGFVAAKTRLDELGFEPDWIGSGHVYTAGTHPDSVYEWDLPRLKRYLREHDATSMHDFLRIFAKGRGGVNLRFAVRDDGTYEVTVNYGRRKFMW